MRAVKHPSEATLALHAGGDLGPIARWRTERHLRQCESCQDEMLAFQEVRRMVSGLAETPELPWARLSAEMQANIRLGLAAGECVRQPESEEAAWKSVFGFRSVLAAASVALVVAVGVLLEKPAPRRTMVLDSQVVVRATNEGVQLSSGSQVLALKHDANVQSISYSANAQGSVGDTYVDPVTGDVTVNKVSW